MRTQTHQAIKVVFAFNEIYFLTEAKINITKTTPIFYARHGNIQG